MFICEMTCHHYDPCANLVYLAIAKCLFFKHNKLNSLNTKRHKHFHVLYSVKM